MARSALPSRLVDALVEVLAPVLARGGGARRIVAVETEDDVALYTVRRGAVTPVTSPAQLARTPAPVEIRLRPERALTRTVRLPTAGRGFFATLLEHRMDRLTPWAAEDVLFDYTVGPAGDDGQADVAVIATSRAIASAVEARLARWGLVGTTLSIAGPPLAAPAALDLWRGARNPTARLARRQVRLAAVAVLAGTLSAAAGALLFAARQDAALADAAAERTAVRRALAAAALAGTAEADAALLAKRPESTVTVLLDDLAARLPDDSHLQRLEVTPEALRLVGLSANAAALVSLLEASALLQDVAFAAAVTLDETGRDRFDLVANRVAPEPEP